MRKEARLRIPKSQLKQLRAELEQLDDAPDDGGAEFFQNADHRQRFVSQPGVRFRRRLARALARKSETKTSKTLVVGAGLFLTGAMATIAFANIGPPLESRSINGKIFSENVHRYKQGFRAKSSSKFQTTAKKKSN